MPDEPRYKFQSIEWWDTIEHTRHVYSGLAHVPSSVLFALRDQIEDEIHARDLLRAEWERRGGRAEIETRLRAVGGVARESLSELRALQRARFVLTGELGTGRGYVSDHVGGVDVDSA